MQDNNRHYSEKYTQPRCFHQNGNTETFVNRVIGVTTVPWMRTYMQFQSLLEFSVDLPQFDSE